MSLVLVTGPVNSGKSAYTERLAHIWKREGRTVRGVLSVAELENGVKRLYRFRDIAAGVEVPYAILKKEPDVYPRYEFLEEGLRFAVSVLDTVMEADLVIIDELGPLEISGGGLLTSARRLCGEFRGMLVLVVREPLVGRLLSLLGIRADTVSVVRLS